MNLAVADIMFAVFIIPNIIFGLFFTVPDGLTGTVLCKLLIGGNIAWFAASSSIATLTVIAIERYYAAACPLKNIGPRLTKRKLKVRPVFVRELMSIKNLQFSSECSLGDLETKKYIASRPPPLPPPPPPHRR